METAMSLARSYERQLVVVAEVNKVLARKPGRLPPPRAITTPATTTTLTMTIAGAAAPTPHPFKRLTTQEMVAWRQAGLCFNYDKPFSHGHKCKMLFDITAVNDYDMEEADASLMMMIGRLQSRVQGASPCILRG
jgi:hypothetical protein